METAQKDPRGQALSKPDLNWRPWCSRAAPKGPGCAVASTPALGPSGGQTMPPLCIHSHSPPCLFISITWELPQTPGWALASHIISQSPWGWGRGRCWCFPGDSNPVPTSYTRIRPTGWGRVHAASLSFSCCSRSLAACSVTPWEPWPFQR